LKVHQIFVAFNIRNKDNHNDDGDEKNKNNIIINIKSQRNALNMQSNTELLQQAYIEISNKI